MKQFLILIFLVNQALASNKHYVNASIDENIDSIRLKIIWEKKYNIPSYGFETILAQVLVKNKYITQNNWQNKFRGNASGFEGVVLDFDNMDFKTKLTYNLICSEQYSQMCSSPWPKFWGSEKVIYRRIITGRSEFHLSDR